MKREAIHISDQDLRTIAFGDDAEQVSAEMSFHIESCASCLSRLQAMTQTEELQASAAEFLSDFHVSGRAIPVEEADAAAPLVDRLEELRRHLQPASHPELLGRLGRYDIERLLGHGGMGIVLKAFDSELNRPVAVKVLAQHLAWNGAARHRFAREARAAAAVVHEHVVAIHDVETEGEAPYLVMQYVPGESLQTRVDREGPLDVRQLLRIGIQAAAGLAAAHEQGVIHRDIKPANILLENQVERVLLTDFGLARTVDDASLTHTGIIAGTPHYMSPEQASGETCDHRTDLFSLGAVLYFMATGRPPFRAEKAIGVLHRICNDSYPSVWSINPDIPDEVCEVIDRLLEKKAHRRFASAAATRDALVGILERVQQPRRRWRQHLRRSLKRQSGRDWMLLAAGVFVLMLALVVPGRHRPQDDADDGAGVVAKGEASATSRLAGADATRVDEFRSDEFQPDESTGQSADSFLSPVPDIALQNAASEQAAGDVSFDRELADLQNQLQQSESVQQPEFMNPPRSDWDQRIEALRRELDEIDGRLNPNAFPSDLLPVNPPTFE